MAPEPSLKYRSSRQEVPRAMQLSDHMKTSGWSGGRRALKPWLLLGFSQGRLGGVDSMALAGWDNSGALGYSRGL